MAFAQTWSEAYLGATTRQDDIDLIVQNTRIATRERGGIEHTTYATEAANLDVWLHKKEAARCNFGLAAAIPVAPTAVGTSGRVTGSQYYETDTGLVKYYNGTAWVTIGGPGHSTLTTTYTTGTVTVTNDSAVLTGSGTAWVANIGTSDVFLGPDSEYYGITSVDSDTQITLSRTYDGTTGAGQSYTLYLDGHPQYLPKSGGTMDGPLTLSGALAMGANKITGLANGTAVTDAAAYGQLPIKSFVTGTYTGDGNASLGVTGTGVDLTSGTWLLAIIAQGSQSSSALSLAIMTDGDTGASTFDSTGSDSAHEYGTTYLASADADGFTVTNSSHSGGNSLKLNASSKNYTYFIFHTA